MNEERKRKFAFLLFFLALAILAWDFLPFPKSQSLDQSSLQKNSGYRPVDSALDRVNAHMMKTDKAMEFDKEKIRVENWKTSVQVGERLFRDKKTPNHDLDFSPDQYEGQVLNDLKRNEKQTDYVSPDSLIQSQLSAAQSQTEYEEEFRREYARQFVENARQAGYEVVLSADFVVVSVKKFRKEDRPALFRAQSSGAE